MSSSLFRRVTAGVAAVGLALALAACSASGLVSTSKQSSSASTGSAEAGAFPVTIKSALGSATITEVPQRVVTIGWGSADTVVSLGTVPVGIEKVTYGNDDHNDYPWVTSAIQKLGKKLPTTFNVYPDIDVSAIVALNPDVIIAPMSGLTKKQYATLSALAPTVAYPGKPYLTTWSDQITIIGKALGKPALAAQKIAAIKNQLATVKKANPEFASKTFAYMSAANSGTLSVYQKGDPRVDLLTAIGLKEDPTVAKIPLSKGSYLATIGLEKADLLNKADVIFSWYYDTANEKETLSQPLIKTIPAVKRGSVVSITDAQLVMGTTFLTPLSVPYALDRYVPLIRDAVAKSE